MADRIKQTNSKLLFITVALWIGTSLWPIFGHVVSYVMTLLVIIIGLNRYPMIFRTRAFIHITLFLLICLLYSLMGKGYPFLNVAILLPTYFACIVASYGISMMSRKQVYALFVFFVGLLLFLTISTFFILQEEPNAVRYIGYGENSEIGVTKSMALTYTRRGMYSYGIGEALAVITPAFIAYALFTKSRVISLLLLITIIMSIITQVLGTLATSLLITIVFSIAVLFTIFLGAGGKQKLRYGLFIIAFVLIGLYYIVPIFLENGSIMMKLIDIEDSYATGESTGQVGGRTDLLLQSLSVFLRNPILGLGNIPQFFGDKTTGNTVSMHTAFFDYLGLYGMFAFFFFSSWKKAIDFTFRKMNKKHKKVYIWCLLSALFLCVLKGPVSLATTFMFSTVFVGIVFMMMYHDSNESVNYNEKNCNLG